MPRRIVTAYWLITYGFLNVAVWITFIAFHLSDSRNTLADSAGLVFTSAIFTLVFLVMLVLSGIWIKAGEVKGHYLGVLVLLLLVLLSLTPSPGVNTLLPAVFLIILIRDLRQLRGNNGFSLQVDDYLLDNFWFVPWLISLTAVAVLSQFKGAVPAAIFHLLSPLLVVFIHIKLIKHARVLRPQKPARYGVSVLGWSIFYIFTCVLGYYLLEGLGGLAMQGAGR